MQADRVARAAAARGGTGGYIVPETLVLAGLGVTVGYFGFPRVVSVCTRVSGKMNPSLGHRNPSVSVQKGGGTSHALGGGRGWARVFK